MGSCNSLGDNSEIENTKFEYDLYQPSEMALLMNQMFLVNDSIKKQIVAGDIPENFPEKFLTIETAVMSETKSRTEIFEAYSKVFIDNQKDLFDTGVNVPLIDKYNNAINTCLACHKTECVGPIPKIEKLLIR
jgi:hypothetical protein